MSSPGSVPLWRPRMAYSTLPSPLEGSGKGPPHGAKPQPADARGVPPALPPTAVGLLDGPGPWQPPRVLVVEAENDMGVLTWLAHQPSFSVVRASPDQASLAFMRTPADIVILTVGTLRWPGQRGDVVRTCKELRGLAGPWVSLLVLGRTSEHRGRRIALHAGADMFLARPASPASLLEALASLLARQGYGT